MSTNGIQAAREAHGVSRYRLAQLIGTTPPNIIRLETKVKSPHRATLQKIAAALNCDVDALMVEAAS